jgi:hypothetical protein
MRLILLSLAAAALVAAPASAKPPREESPAPKELVQAPAMQTGDAELDAQIAAAGARPLGSLGNPIRVAGPEGEQNYLHKLRCPDGTAPMIGQREDGGVGTYGTVTDAFEVTCRGAPAVRLVMDMYHEVHVVTRAPAGFTILAG